MRCVGAWNVPRIDGTVKYPTECGVIPHSAGYCRSLINKGKEVKYPAPRKKRRKLYACACVRVCVCAHTCECAFCGVVGYLLYILLKNIEF